MPRGLGLPAGQLPTRKSLRESDDGSTDHGWRSPYFVGDVYFDPDYTETPTFFRRGSQRNSGRGDQNGRPICPGPCS